MERPQWTFIFPWRTLAGAATMVGVLVVSGCGSERKAYKNDPRPPAPINVAAYVSPDRISISPSSFGAGPIVVIVTNQSDTSQEVTLDGSRVEQSTGPINPGDTGEIKVFVHQGTYTLHTSSGLISPATMVVSEERESAQNEVLQP